MEKTIKNNRTFLAYNILRYRKAMGWTQEQLAFEAGTTNKCISDLELGKRNVKLDTISKIAKSLGVNLADLTKPF